MNEWKERDVTWVVPKTWREYNEVDRKNIDKIYRENKLLVSGIGPDEYNLITTCEHV